MVARISLDRSFVRPPVLSSQQERRLVRDFYALRGAIRENPTAFQCQTLYKRFRSAYADATRAPLSALPRPEDRRQWIDHLFLELLPLIPVDVWNSNAQISTSQARK